MQLPLHRPVPTSEGSHRYCYEGSHQYTLSALLHVWDVIVIFIETKGVAPPLVKLFPVENDTQDSVQESSHLGSSHFFLSPFGESCVEVRGTDHTPSSEEEYTLKVTRTLPPYYPGLLAIGIILFFIAPYLSRLVTHPWTTPLQ